MQSQPAGMLGSERSLSGLSNYAGKAAELKWAAQLAVCCADKCMTSCMPACVPALAREHAAQAAAAGHGSPRQVQDPADLGCSKVFQPLLSSALHCSRQSCTACMYNGIYV